MNINAVTPYNSNFQARIKIDRPKLEVLTQSAISLAATAAGAATVADGALSANTVYHNSVPIEGLPKAAVDSHKSILFENNNGKGVPVLSTVAPMGLSGSGAYVIHTGSNAFRNAFGDDNLKATSMLPSGTSQAVFENKIASNALMGSSVLGAVAANMYSATNIDSVNDMLPESVKFGDADLDKLQLSSLITVGAETGIPSVSGSLYSSDKLSKTKSSQFISDTLTNPKSSKKIPS